MRLSCGGIFSNHVTANLLLGHMRTKEFRKSFSVWRSKG